MPPPLTTNTWNGHVQKIARLTSTVAECSMKRAANEVRKPEEDVSNVTASFDGTWQRRGFSSKNGIATAITVNNGSSKVVDTETMSNYCNKCSIMINKLSENDFKIWYENHKSTCSINYTGSAGGMEPVGMEQIFRRSVKLRKLQYTGYLGDGDCKSYNSVSSAQPPIYGNTIDIQKLEYCGHVQKRMGKRLMDLVSKNKNTIFREGNKRYKGIGGQGRLTQKAIMRIQGHYGAAIRNNPGNVSAMKRGIMRIYKHRAKDHSDCEEWCPSKSGKRDPNQYSLPDYVCKIIKPVFEFLSSDELLTKCAHGGTQNTNESFHNLIWERCPKTTFVGRRRLQLAVHDATIVYNEGELSRLTTFQALGLSAGRHLRDGLCSLDAQRLKNAYVPGQKAIIKARRARSQVSKQQKDDGSYGAGNF